MKHLSRIDSFGLLSLIVMLALMLPGVCSAAEFQADVLVQAQGEKPIHGKIYVKGTMIRHEMEEEGQKQIMIVRPDKNLSWMIVPEEKMYMEIPYQPDEQTFEEWTAEKEKNSKYLGDETISGVECKKYEMEEEGEKSTFWISKKYAFPIKVVGPDSTMEYKNLKDGAVPDALFEVPPDYEKMAMPMLPGDSGEE